jgi:hypothetical protein
MLYSFEEETDIAVEIKRHTRDSSTDEMDTNRYNTYNTYVDRRTFEHATFCSMYDCTRTISESMESNSGQSQVKLKLNLLSNILKKFDHCTVYKWTIVGLCTE